MSTSSQYPSSCRYCGSSVQDMITKYPNANGNGGRPFLKCSNSTCDRFLTFTDTQGVPCGSSNASPMCYCGQPARLLVSGRDDQLRKPRSLFFKCAYGQCDFFRYKVNRNENVETLSEDRIRPHRAKRFGHVQSTLDKLLRLTQTESGQWILVFLIGVGVYAITASLKCSYCSFT